MGNIHRFTSLKSIKIEKKIYTESDKCLDKITRLSKNRKSGSGVRRTGNETRNK